MPLVRCTLQCQKRPPWIHVKPSQLRLLRVKMHIINYPPNKHSTNSFCTTSLGVYPRHPNHPEISPITAINGHLWAKILRHHQKIRQRKWRERRINAKQEELKALHVKKSKIPQFKIVHFDPKTTIATHTPSWTLNTQTKCTYYVACLCRCIVGSSIMYVHRNDNVRVYNDTTPRPKYFFPPPSFLSDPR